MKKERKELIEAVLKRLNLSKDEPQIMIQLSIDMLAYVLTEMSTEKQGEGVIAGTGPDGIDYIFALGEIARELKSSAVEKQYDEYKKI